MENINWKEIAKWSNDRPESFTVIWDVRPQRTIKTVWKLFTNGIRRPSRAYVTGFVKRKVNGRVETTAAIVKPYFGYFIEPKEGIQFVVDKKSSLRYEDLFEHIRSKGIEVKVVVIP